MVRQAGKLHAPLFRYRIDSAQVEGFLRKMAEDVDLKALKVFEKTLNAKPDPDSKKPLFRPMRRKMQLEA